MKSLVKQERVLILYIGMVGLLLLLSVGQQYAADYAALPPETFADTAEKVLPSVIKVNITRHVDVQVRTPRNLPDLFEFFFGPDTFEQEEKTEKRQIEIPSSGSGVIVGSDGYIVTNSHVVMQAQEGEIEVTLNDGRTYSDDKVTIIGSDPLTDLAVIKVEEKNLPTLEWGDSDKARIGNWVLAVGSPLELTGTVSQGIISAKNRKIGRAVFEDFLQTTAVINPGNSGGPLVDLKGDIIGINTAIVSVSGLWGGVSFSIPSNMARRITNDLIQKGKVERGYLGIYMDTADALAAYYNLDDKKGVSVTKVVPESPAQKAGIEQADIVKKVNGEEVENPVALLRSIAGKGVGEKVEIEFLREVNGKISTKKVKARLTRRPGAKELAESAEKSSEIEVIGDQTFIEELDAYVSPDQENRIVIDKITINSRLLKARIQPSDRIISVNKIKVGSSDALEDALGKGREKGDLFLCERNSQRFFAFVPNE